LYKGYPLISNYNQRRVSASSINGCKSTRIDYCGDCFSYSTNGSLVEDENLHNNIGGVVMITVKNAENYLKDKIGEEAEDIKKVWETFKVAIFIKITARLVNR
jgi:hypothetical protein